MYNRGKVCKDSWRGPTRRTKNSTSTYSSSPEGLPGVQAFKKGKHPTSDFKQKSLACPYRKKYLQCKPKASSCLHPFPDISRLKEHLYRCHMEKHQCLRCRAPFGSQALLERHMQATNICQPCRQPETQVFGRAIQDKLKKRETKKSDEEKWIGVYRTLFPDDTDIPLPYHDELPLAEYRERAWDRLPDRLELALRALVVPHTGASILSESVLSEVIKAARACNDDLVQEFQCEQQRESAQDQSLELSEARPPPLVTSTNTPRGLDEAESMDVQQDAMSSGHIQQFTFANTAMLSTSESPNYLTGGSSGDNGNYPNISMMNFNWDSEKTVTHASTSSQTWCEPEYCFTDHLATEGSFPSTDAQTMQFLPTRSEDLIALQNPPLPSIFPGMDATGFTVDMFLSSSQTPEAAF